MHSAMRRREGWGCLTLAHHLCEAPGGSLEPDLRKEREMTCRGGGEG